MFGFVGHNTPLAARIVELIQQCFQAGEYLGLPADSICIALKIVEM